ncbi:hypothetical protein SKAU_G00095470 [Synaphobranchus kaupii]|uniref:Uncharacterized protein n=1 Tax=Synaphobranchus kaupii TaxID=118154 RepID=A0A9Q1FX90_SYNKA|nr:hypothetical protein SKAU_G00095470 [Synaphobranchus kaupii]
MVVQLLGVFDTEHCDFEFSLLTPPLRNPRVAPTDGRWQAASVARSPHRSPSGDQPDSPLDASPATSTIAPVSIPSNLDLKARTPGVVPCSAPNTTESVPLPAVKPSTAEHSTANAAVSILNPAQVSPGIPCRVSMTLVHRSVGCRCVIS